jgi:hypothetical protein
MAYTINPLKTKKLKLQFFAMIPMYGKELGCLKSKRLQPRACLMRETWKLWWVWSFDGMILGVENKIRWNLVSVPCYPPQISHGIAWDQTRFSAAKIVITLHYTHMQYTYIIFVLRRDKCAYIRKTSRWMLWRYSGCFCKKHTEKIIRLCGRKASFWRWTWYT